MHWKKPQTPSEKTLPVSGSPTTLDQADTRTGHVGKEDVKHVFPQRLSGRGVEADDFFPLDVGIGMVADQHVQLAPHADRRGAAAQVGPFPENVFALGRPAVNEPFFRETPLSSGPRQFGQSIGAAAQASPVLATAVFCAKTLSGRATITEIPNTSAAHNGCRVREDICRRECIIGRALNGGKAGGKTRRPVEPIALSTTRAAGPKQNIARGSSSRAYLSNCSRTNFQRFALTLLRRQGY